MEKKGSRRIAILGALIRVDYRPLFFFNPLIIPELGADWLGHHQGRGEISDSCAPDRISDYENINAPT